MLRVSGGIFWVKEVGRLGELGWVMCGGGWEIWGLFVLDLVGVFGICRLWDDVIVMGLRVGFWWEIGCDDRDRDLKNG